MSNIDKQLFDKINEQCEIYLLHYQSPLLFEPDYLRWRDRFLSMPHYENFLMSFVKFDIFAEKRYLKF